MSDYLFGVSVGAGLVGAGIPWISGNPVTSETALAIAAAFSVGSLIVSAVKSFRETKP